MHPLIAAALCAGVACGGSTVALPRPDYPSIRYRAPKEATREPGVLFLVASGTNASETAAFLAGFCGWVKATPAVAAKYQAVFLMPSVEGDPLGDVATSISQMVDSISVGAAPEGPPLPGGAKGADAGDLKSSMAKFEDLAVKLTDERVRGYLCAESKRAVGEPNTKVKATVLAVAHSTLAPYGVGLRYFAMESEGVPRRGFYKFVGDELATDARRLAATALASPEEAIALDAMIQAPPEAYCQSAESGLCIYQPSTMTVRFAYQDTAFLLADEIAASPIERWTITRDGLADSSSVMTEVVAAEGGLGIDVHFRNPGKFRIEGSFLMAGTTQVSRNYDLDVTVQAQSIVLVKERVRLNTINRDQMDNISDLTESGFSVHALQRQIESLRPRVTFTDTCLSFLFFCRQPSTETMEKWIADKLAGYGFLAAAEVTTLRESLMKELLDPDLTTQPEEWRMAVSSSVSHDAVREALRRSRVEGARSDGPWCDAIVKAAQRSLYQVSGVSMSRSEEKTWRKRCQTALKRMVEAAAERLKPIRAFDVWPDAREKAWLQTDVDSPIEIAGKTHWLRHGDPLMRVLRHRMSFRKYEQRFSTRLVARDADGGEAEPIDVDLETKGGRGFLDVGIYGSLVVQVPPEAKGDLAEGDAGGVLGGRAAVPLAEVVTIAAEGEIGSFGPRLRIGGTLTPWCLARWGRSTFCREMRPEPEVLIEVRDGEYWQTVVGVHVTVPTWRSKLGLIGSQITVHMRAGSAHVIQLGLGVGFSVL